MVEKLKFLYMTGPGEDLDRVMAEYLEHYEIHFEPAISVLGEKENLIPIAEKNPYQESYETAKKFRREFPKEIFETVFFEAPEEAAHLVKEVSVQIGQIDAKREAFKQKKCEWREKYERILPFRTLDYEFGKLADFKWITVWFCRIPLKEYPGFRDYADGEEHLLFYECSTKGEIVFGVCFVPEADAAAHAAALSCFQVEQVKIEEAKMQMPEEICTEIEEELASCEEKITALIGERVKILINYRSKICGAYECLKRYCSNFAVRDYAAYIKPGGCYVLCGFLRERDVRRIIEETRGDKKFQVSVKDANGADIVPPTKLRNLALFRPFEFLVELYGLPAYGEMDPTVFVALTYNLMFGMMFGDVGQGLCLFVAGEALSHGKGIRLGRIISSVGIFSAVFGLLYGSVFGFENVLKPVWRRPAEDIGTTLLLAVGFGTGLILFAMMLNIINGIRAGERGRVLFSENGVAGILCYGGLVLFLLGIVTKTKLPLFQMGGAAFMTALLFILFQKPLAGLFDGTFGKAETEKKSVSGIGMMVVEQAVELFDVVLGYLTNSISFVRLGAFALSHAGMMEIVLLLAGYESGNFHWALAAAGNLLVMCMEGLVAAIQVLRLEYYEMFGRFYRGNGKAFVTFGKQTEREDGRNDD